MQYAKKYMHIFTQSIGIIKIIEHILYFHQTVLDHQIHQNHGVSLAVSCFFCISLKSYISYLK